MVNISPRRIYVIDDDAGMREALEELLSAMGFDVQCFAGADDYLAQGNRCGPACILLDLDMPGINGLELQGQLRQPDHPPIVFISGRGDIPSSAKAFKAGAIDFLTKPFSDDQLLEAIERAMDLDAQRIARRQVVDELTKRFSELTPREKEVLPLITSGLLNKQGAAELGISEITFQIHRGKVLHKMKASSVADLVRMADLLNIPVTHSRSGSQKRSL